MGASKPFSSASLSHHQRKPIKTIKMGFGDLKTEAGIKVLNEFMANKSYIDGYVPSQADVAVFHLMKGAPASQFAHALRWYNHIKTYSAQFEILPGIMGAAEKYGPIKRPQVADDDDEEDLFGSDSEDDAEAEKIKQERLKAYAEKKAKKPGPIAKSNIILDVKPWDDETDMAEVESLVRTI